MSGEPYIVMAADMPYRLPDGMEGMQLKPILEKLVNCEDLHAVKIGLLTLGKKSSLEEVTDAIKNAGKKVIFDMQKMGQDIPDVTFKQAELFGSVSDAVIVYPKSLEHWKAACQGAVGKSGSNLITVLYMTDGYDDLEKRKILAKEILTYAKETKLPFFGTVLPANKPAVIDTFVEIFNKFEVHPEIFSPGLEAQGGKAYEIGKRGAHGIAGRAIYEAEDPVAALKKLKAELKCGYEERVRANLLELVDIRLDGKK